jgi:S-DNA-T family DNA segregation ATPase FtsK/SpoIIIE
MKKWIGKFYSDLVGIGFLLMSTVTLLSLYSYNPTDPSFNHLTFMRAQNLCGLVGSFWSDSVFHLFGLGSWLWVPYFGFYGVDGVRGRLPTAKHIQFLPFLALVLIATSLMQLHFSDALFYNNNIQVGGLIGDLIGRGLERILNPIGSKILLWVGVAVLAVVLTQKNLRELYEFVLGFFPKEARLDKKSTKDTDDPFKAIEYKLEKDSESETLQEKLKNVVTKRIKEVVPAKKSEKSVAAEFSVQSNDEEEDAEASTQVAPALKTAPKRKVILKSHVPARIENWNMPKLNLLEDPPATRAKVDKEELKRKAEQLTEKLKLFNVTGNVVAVKSGPAVTMFEFKPNAEVKLSNITSMENDLAIALSSESLRIIAPIPGRDVVGIESSNTTRETVYLKDLLAEEDFWKDDMKLPIALGRQTNGDPQIVDLRKMPHLLVAGSTGSGKSVFTVSTITGLLFRHSPKTLRMILIDPKQVDLAAFSQIPHLLLPPIVETPKAVAALRWAVKEMDKRYRSMSKFGARGLEAYNETVKALSSEDKEAHKKTNDELEDKNKKNQKYYFEELPYLVIVVEEFGDLMQIDSDNVEQSVVRLAQLARACGIHLTLCMQSPRKEIVTGLIKTNIPGRISFKVASKMDSRIILDESGAERLLARGDMLFRAPGTDKPVRHHGPWLSDAEINKVAQFWSEQSEPQYDAHLMSLLEDNGDRENRFSDDSSGGDNEYDEMYDEVVAFASSVKEISASLLQRKYRLGYPRAARLIEIMEREGVIGGANGSKPRQVLVKGYGPQ